MNVGGTRGRMFVGGWVGGAVGAHGWSVGGAGAVCRYGRGSCMVGLRARGPRALRGILWSATGFGAMSSSQGAPVADGSSTTGVDTPTKHSPRGVDIHSCAARLPPPRKTGCDVTDEDNMARFVQLQQLVSYLVEDNSHVPALWEQLKKRKASRVEGATSFGDLFRPAGTLRTMLDDAWVIDYVASISDIPVAELIKCKAYDEDGPKQLLQMATQAPLHSKPAEELLVKAVSKRIFDVLNVKHGMRLQRFFARGGLKDGVINWSMGCYTPTYGEDGILKKVTHVSGDAVDVSSYAITSDWLLVDNYADWSAMFSRKPMAPTKAHMFFKSSAKGPYKIAALSVSSKPWKDLLRQEHHGWTIGRAQVHAGSGVANSEEQVAQLKSSKAKAASATARAAATVALEKKRAKRTVVLG